MYLKTDRSSRIYCEFLRSFFFIIIVQFLIIIMLIIYVPSVLKINFNIFDTLDITFCKHYYNNH